MIDPSYLNVLRKIYARLNDSDMNWVVTGSLGFALQGVLVEPNDIDIQTDEAGAYEIERFFSEFVIQKVAFSSAERIRSYFGVLMMDEIKVEIMGDIRKRLEDGTWEDSVDLNRHKRIVEVEGMQVPVLSLEYEHQAYLKLGRVNQAEMLRRWLTRREYDAEHQDSHS
ncbi:MAG: nucleotidyltransferase domain-containing protein [Candidatus Bipolaricaulia bacterium]